VEEGIVKQEKYAVIVTPGTLTVIADVWDLDAWNQADASRGPILTEVGQTREHAIRKLMYAIVKED